MVALPRTIGTVADGVADGGAGATSVTSPVKASERAVARYSVPPCGSGHLAVMWMLLVDPPTIRFGSTSTRTSCRETETSGVGRAGVGVIVGSAETVSADAVQPSAPNSKAPPTATCVILLNGTP